MKIDATTRLLVCATNDEQPNHSKQARGHHSGVIAQIQTAQERTIVTTEPSKFAGQFHSRRFSTLSFGIKIPISINGRL
jgi:hypothetical protein